MLKIPALFLLCFTGFVVGFQTKQGTKLIIDNDAGGDDSMAIFIALLHEKYFNGPKLIGLTTVNGNTKEENVYVNNQKILQIANRQDIPIYRGVKESIVTTPPTNSYYGEDGLGDSEVTVTGLVPAQKQNAVSYLIEQSKIHKGDLLVVTIGPVTNLALAIKLDPGFLNRISHLYIAAGHIFGKNHPNPEFNAYMDVEAYHIIAQHANPEKVTLLPFSLCKDSLNLTMNWRQDALGSIDTDLMKAQNRHERVALLKSDVWHSLDPAMVACVVNPDLVKEYNYSKNDIILCGEKRGINTNSYVGRDDANVRIIQSIKNEKYKQFLVNLFLSEVEPKEI